MALAPEPPQAQFEEAESSGNSISSLFFALLAVKAQNIRILLKGKAPYWLGLVLICRHRDLGEEARRLLF